MIRHFLKDGTEVPGIDGMVVPVEGHEVLYRVVGGL